MNIKKRGHKNKNMTVKVHVSDHSFFFRGKEKATVVKVFEVKNFFFRNEKENL